MFIRWSFTQLPVWFLLTSCSLVTRSFGAESADVDFSRDIRPILSRHCFECHGFDAKSRKAGLRLDTEAGVRLASGSGGDAVVAGAPRQSQLIARVTSDDETFRMPPADVSDPLRREQIDLLVRWIAQGARWSEHWSLVPPRRSTLPRTQRTAWPIGSIDAFVWARLQARGIAPSETAGRHTLLRRLSLDLTGLPPTPRDIDALIGDTAPDACERVVDRLLASPHYGERMARRWLDLARYADSSGYANDKLRSIWPWRDWVIAALNDDMPFDQFTIEQLAGDLLPGGGRSQTVASGFHRNTPHQYEGGSDPEQYRVERVKNRVDTTGTVWLGLTVGCAQCHTHKFDPISQREYYQLYAFFNNSDEPTESLPSASQQRALVRLDGSIAEVKAQPEAIDDEQRSAELTKRLDELVGSRDQLLESLPTTLVVRERTARRETFVQIRGDFLSPGERVIPGVPARLHGFRSSKDDPPDRLDLARWLMQPDNPLTARVTVNRAWQHFFGRGLVETENDFGHQGSPPTYPGLLDWLAREFIDGGFGFKRLHRLIVSSAAYRQSSRLRPDLVELDPRNRLIARQSRHRVEAEVIRDMALAASGLLSRRIGGPSVFPPIPPNVIGTSSARHKWPTSTGGDRFRRGLYTAVYRANSYPMLSTFDGPDRDNACTRRNRSNTPLQSLALSNDPAMSELFRGLAGRILTEAAGQTERMVCAFRICLCRSPTEAEVDRLMRFHEQQRVRFAAQADDAARLAADQVPQGASTAEVAVWYSVGRLLMNLDEFVTRE